MPFVPELLNFVSDVFLETGTFQGDTIAIIANNNVCKPSKIISIELSDIFFNNCLKRFAENPAIVLHKGNSKYDLYNIIKDIDTKITFWLDGHWSGTPNVGCDPITICPVLEELEQIKKHRLNTHTIMIDDIRLMNNNNDRYHGFPVTKDEIFAKLYEINPHYKIKYFDDYTAANDVLVAYIEEKTCIHKYLTVCATNPQPPGFADYLRGTFALYNFSKKYGYKLLIDGTHPIFKCLRKNKNIIYSNNDSKTEEFLPPLSYNDIYTRLEDRFKTGSSFSVMTNSFYNLNNGSLTNFGSISEDCALYMKDILSPTEEVIDKLNYVFSTVYKLSMSDSFKVFHLRCGDKFIHTNVYSEELYQEYYKKINNKIAAGKPYILISDSSEIAKKLKTNIPELLYWDNSKIHLGDLIHLDTSTVLDTVVDFFIMSRANEIISNGSGFSLSNSLIYNIKYTYF